MKCFLYDSDKLAYLVEMDEDSENGTPIKFEPLTVYSSSVVSSTTSMGWHQVSPSHNQSYWHAINVTSTVSIRTDCTVVQSYGSVAHPIGTRLWSLGFTVKPYFEPNDVIKDMVK